jgi:TRAP-type uncharacterized transport system substrate-binding protein
MTGRAQLRIRWIEGVSVFASLCAVLCVSATTAQADGIVIASGTKGGYYHAVARGLRVVLFNEYGIPTDVASSSGSMANLAELADPDSLVNVALAQADALQSHLAVHPEFAKEYVQVGDAGKECAFIVVGRNAGIDSLEALTSRDGRTISIGDSGSGAAITWANMSRLHARLAKVDVVEQGTIEALLAIQSGEAAHGPTAAMMVQRPMAVATPLEIVLQNAKDFALVPIVRSDLPTSVRGTESLEYTFEKVIIGFGRDNQSSVDTICTRALILAAKKKLSADELEAVGKAVVTSRQFILSGER